MCYNAQYVWYYFLHKDECITRFSYLHERTFKSHAAYNKQGNYCTSFLWKEKRNCFETIDPSKITDNKMFWKTVKPICSQTYVLNKRA